MNLRFAQVIAVHPERRTLDLAYCDTGLPVAEVQVLCGTVSSDAGTWDVPDAPRPRSQAEAGGLAANGRRVIAVVAAIGLRPVVVGFVHPSGGGLVFNEQNRQITRHPSGAYTTIAPDGSIEVWHPSGAYLRIGTGAHQDLAPVVAGSWPVPAGAPAAQITLATEGFTLTVEPGGKTTLVSQGDGSLQFVGKLDVSAAGAMTLHSDTSITATAPTIDLNP